MNLTTHLLLLPIYICGIALWLAVVTGALLILIVVAWCVIDLIYDAINAFR